MEKAYPQSQELGSGVIDTLARVKEVKKFKVSVPGVVEVESDSGNHLVDIGSVVIIIGAFFLIRKFFKAT